MTLSIPKFEDVPATKAQLDWAELPVLDMLEYNKPGGKERLAEILDHAVQEIGFFYIKNFGIPDEDVDRQFGIANSFFDLPLEEKLKYYEPEKFFSGNSQGYRPVSIREPINGIPDNTQLLVMSKYDGYHDQQLPPALQPHVATMEKFQRDCHDKVVYPLLRLCAKVLELEDEEHLVKQHLYNEEGETQYRFMHYAHRTAEENKLLGNIYAGGHTDLGGITLLFRQPIVALQVFNSRKEWKWIKPMPGHIVVNICDALSAMTGGYFKSTIHRVHTPPADQAHLDRTGVLLLSRANNNVVLNPIMESPLLQRLGRTTNTLTELGHMMNMKQWTLSRQAQHSRRPKPVNDVAEKGEYLWDEEAREFAPGLRIGNYA